MKGFALSMLRSICIVFLACLVLALRPQLAFAQVVVGTPTRAINTAAPGYCFTDDDPVGGDGAIGLSEINITSGTPAMTDATIPARDGVPTGTRLIVPSPIHIFDNWPQTSQRKVNTLLTLPVFARAAFLEPTTFLRIMMIPTRLTVLLTASPTRQH